MCLDNPLPMDKGGIRITLFSMQITCSLFNCPICVIVLFKKMVGGRSCKFPHILFYLCGGGGTYACSSTMGGGLTGMEFMGTGLVRFRAA